MLTLILVAVAVRWHWHCPCSYHCHYRYHCEYCYQYRYQFQSKSQYQCRYIVSVLLLLPLTQAPFPTLLGTGRLKGQYPWEGITIPDLERVFRAHPWGKSLAAPEFDTVLSTLGVACKECGRPLFEAFDEDNNGRLEPREVAEH